MAAHRKRPGEPLITVDVNEVPPLKLQKTANDTGPEPEVENDSSETTIAKRILQDYFGYSSFRYEQLSAVTKLLQGENTLVVFPTGAGKSLCYQVILPSWLTNVDSFWSDSSSGF
jgi:superfamily II DNA helicase RecQ